MQVNNLEATEAELRANTMKCGFASLSECGCVPVSICPCSTGETGATGPGRSAIYFAADQSISNGDFLGLGTSSSMFIRNTVVIAEASNITSLTFNIRDNPLQPGDFASAEVFIGTCGVTGATGTGTIAGITGVTGTTGPCCAFTAANFPANQCDLISVRIDTGDGAFPAGAAATIQLITP